MLMQCLKAILNIWRLNYIIKLSYLLLQNIYEASSCRLEVLGLNNFLRAFLMGL